ISYKLTACTLVFFTTHNKFKNRSVSLQHGHGGLKKI
ncbi:MAG: hypothetical protein ACI8RD_012033, partial [Bacillariaceae sp.]